MKQIHKFQVVSSNFEIESHPGPVLSLILQGSRAVFYIEADLSQTKITRSFRFVGTGHEPPPNTAKFIGTFPDGNFVWHLYET